VGGERGRHGDQGTPARRRRQAQAQRSGRKKQLCWKSSPEDEALGRSKGGFSTKPHLACDGRGRPLSVVLTPGQRHGSTQLEGLLDAVRVARPQGSPGRPRKRPSRLLAERDYSYERCRELLRGRGIPHTIPERKDQKERRAGRPGRRPGFDREAYRRRNVVERCMNRLKQWRGIATRYEKRAVNYRAMVVIASLMMWLPS
jgi:transposase